MTIYPIIGNLYRLTNDSAVKDITFKNKEISGESLTEEEKEFAKKWFDIK